MKKYLIFVLCLFLLVLAAMPAFAADDTKITVTASKTVVQRGETVELTFSISGTTPLTSIAVIPVFNADYFEFVSAVAGNADNFMVDTYTPGNPISLLGLSAGTPSGVIQTITLKVKDTAPIQTVGITHDGISAANSMTGATISVAFEGVTIFVNCPHEYPDTWTMTADGAKHQRVCTKCGTPQTEDHIWPDEGKVDPIPSCTTGGKETFKCADCEATKVEDIDPQGHAWDNACDTTCNNNCGETRTIVHNYSAAYQSDGTNHWKECQICQDKKNVEAHVPGAAPTELSAQTCTVCKRELQPALAHVHNFSTEWETDAESHYHRCLSGSVKCYVKKDEDRHDFDNECDIDCNTCGYIRIAPHKYDPSWKGSDAGHWHTCTICGRDSDVMAHVPGPEATKDTPQICEDCNFVIAVPLDHEHNYGETWYHDNNQHWQTCSECSKSSTPTDHTWDDGVVLQIATDSTPGSKLFTCTVCAAEKIEEMLINDSTNPSEPANNPTESTGAVGTEDPAGSRRFPWQIAGIAAVVLMIAGIVLLIIEAVRSRKTNMHGKFSK